MPHTKVACLIPARGGSKRLPRKNLLPIGGKPLVVHSIDGARGSRRVDRVVVSTDDPELERVARAAGAEVVRRPPEISGDSASSESALLHALDSLESHGYAPDLLVFLQPTSPVRRPDDIDRAIERFESSGADSLFSACRNDKLLWRMENGRPRSLNYDYRTRKRDQEFPEEYRENGSIYVFTPALLRRENNRMGGKIVIYEMDFWSSFQVDDENDVKLMEWIMAHRKELLP